MTDQAVSNSACLIALDRIGQMEADAGLRPAQTAASSAAQASTPTRP